MRGMSTAPQFQLRDEDDDVQDGKMGFLEHLDELRKRLIRACIALAVGMLVAFAFVDRLADFVLQPTLRMLPPGSTLIITKPGENFSFYLDVAFIGGVVLAAPFIMFQVWRFIAPGLRASEKRMVVPFVLLTVLGTIGGALFTHYVLYPGMIGFFSTFKSRHVTFMPKIEDTFDLYKNMIVGMVAVFQLPTLVFFLARMRLVTARFLWRHFDYAILVIFILAAVLTPSVDPWNQTVFAAPMIVLYVLSIGIAWIVGPKREKASSTQAESNTLRLVVGAMVIDQALSGFGGPSRPRARATRGRI
jgi:sec-independent protein translocase protein TatC